MKCLYQAAFVTHSLGLAEGDELSLLSDPLQSATAVLTCNADRWLRIGDRSIALGTLLLKGAFGDAEDGTTEERLQREINAVVDQRQKKLGGSPVLIVTKEFDIEPVLTGPNRAFQDFELYFDAIDKASIRERARPVVDAVIGGLIALAKTPPAFDRLAEYVYGLPSPDRYLYSLTAKMGASVNVARRLDPAHAATIRSLLPSKKLARLGTVFRLLRAAVDSQTEPLRAFVAAWTALEVLTIQNFKEYEQLWFKESTRDQPDGVHAHLLRTREIVDGKYSLVDKFRIMALMLDRERTTANTELFRKLKKTRDEILHGQEKADAQLPTYDTVELVRRYLHLHLVDRQSDRTVDTDAPPALGGQPNRE